MKVKCTKCNIVEEITDENLALLTKIITVYNPKPKASDYVAVLSIIKGDCLDRDKHVFSFDESFMQEVDDIRNQYEEATNKRNIYNGDVLKADDDINRCLSEIKDLEAKAREIESTIDKLQKEKGDKIKELENTDSSISDIMTKLENLTGVKDVKMWS